MKQGPDVELLQRAWEAGARGDLSVVEAALARNAKWRAIEDGPWNCENRRAILEVLERNLASGLRGRIEQALQKGERILVGFRPDGALGGGRPLDDGIAYLVVTVRAGKIVEMKGCADRASALAYRETGLPPAPSTTAEIEPGAGSR